MKITLSSLKSATRHQLRSSLSLLSRNSIKRPLSHSTVILNRIISAIIKDLCSSGADDGADGVCCCVEVEPVEVTWDVAEEDFCWGSFCELFVFSVSVNVAPASISNM